MLQQVADYRIYDQAFYFSRIESAEEKEEKRTPRLQNKKGRRNVCDRRLIFHLGNNFLNPEK